MFRWRKRNEGFEWRTYVRTTILVRRQERRQRVEDVKAAAVFGVKQAGKKGVGAAGSGLKSAGSGSLSALRWSARKLRAGMVKSGAGLAVAAQRGAAGARLGWGKSRAALAPKLSAAGAAAGAAAVKVAGKLEPATAPLREPGLQLALKLIAGVAVLGAAIRAYQFGFDGSAWTAIGVAFFSGFLLFLTGTLAVSRPLQSIRRALSRTGDILVLLPGLDRLSKGAAGAVTLMALVLTVSGALWWQRSGPELSFARFAAAPAAVTPKPSRDPAVLEGYATVQTGDTMRLAGTTVRLEGIEAPDRSQTCSKPNGKRWDCAGAARDALSRLVRSKRITCTLTDTADGGTRTGTCDLAGSDIAAELVRSGDVFAASGFFAPYSDQEAAAQEAKTGVWAGDAVRPAEWRAARWEDAKTKAPDGCPIKGQVFRKTGKVYMLPWSPDYERARVDQTLGERWFCSESEAKSAGWKPL